MSILLVQKVHATTREGYRHKGEKKESYLNGIDSFKYKWMKEYQRMNLCMKVCMKVWMQADVYQWYEVHDANEEI